MSSSQQQQQRPSRSWIEWAHADPMAAIQAATPRLTRYIPHRPTPKQAAALCLSHYREVFYGGAARGGKSDYLLMAALQYVDQPGYSAVIFRRTLTDLSKDDALIPRSHEWLAGTDASWHETAGRAHGGKTWAFPSGAKLSFAFMDGPRDHLSHQGAAYQFVGFDELTHWPNPDQYTYLFSRLTRLEGVDIPLRMRSTSNPGGPGHNWVKQRFIKPGKPSRPFIPALVEDLAGIVDVDAYIESLEELDSVTRRQLRSGDWDVSREGSLFKRDWLPLAKDAPPADTEWVRYWDLAATEGGGDYTVGVKMGRSNGTYYIADVEREQFGAGGVETLLRKTAEEDRRQAQPGDVPVWIEEEGGSSGKADAAAKVKLLAGFTVHTQRPTGSKDVRARPLAAQAEKGNVCLLPGDWNEDFIDELCAFDPDAKGFGVAHDDQVDAASGAFGSLTSHVPWWQDDRYATANAAPEEGE